MVEFSHKTLGTIGAPMEKEDVSEKQSMDNMDLRSLIELGCIKEEVEILGFKFILRSLSATERIELSKEFDPEKGDYELFQFNLKLLAMSIESVNGKPLEVLHPNPTGDVLTTKMDIIATLQTPVISKLIDVCGKIMSKCDKQFTMDQVKN